MTKIYFTTVLLDDSSDDQFNQRIIYFYTITYPVLLNRIIVCTIIFQFGPECVCTILSLNFEITVQQKRRKQNSKF